MACKFGYRRGVFANFCRFVRINFEHELMAKQVAIVKTSMQKGSQIDLKQP